MTAIFNQNISSWVKDIINNPRNLATETELHEQARAALNLFLGADADGSNSLGFDELRVLCDTAGLPMESDEEEALAKMDTDDSGCLDIKEWVVWWLKRVSTLPNPLKQQEAIARITFRKFDADGSGSMDAAELGRLTKELGADFTADELEQALGEIDEDGSGLIDESEFVLWWTNRSASNHKSSSMIALKMKRLAAKAAQLFSTDIFTAVWEGDKELVRGFLDAERRLANASDATEYGDGWCPLHYACFQGHREIVRMLLDEGAKVNSQTNLGFTPLFYAAQRGHTDVCKTLMESGADPTLYGAEPVLLRESEEGERKKPPPVVFMCPVEHCADYPELRSLFEAHEKCAAPRAVDAARVTALLTASGVLKIGFSGPQRDVSHLPVKHWDALLVVANASPSMSGGVDAEALTLDVVVPAVPPHRHSQDLAELPLDRGWVQKLHFLAAVHRMKGVKLIEASDAGLAAVWKEIYNCYQSIADVALRKSIVATLEDTLLQAIGTYEDPKGVELLTMHVKRCVHLVQQKLATQKMSVRADAVEKQKKAEEQQADPAYILDQAVAMVVAAKPPMIPATDTERAGPVIEVLPAQQLPAVSLELAAVNAMGKGRDSDSVDVTVNYPQITTRSTDQQPQQPKQQQQQQQQQRQQQHKQQTPASSRK